MRLVEVTYDDSDERMKEKSFIRKGFLIESPPELADRVGGKRVEAAGVSMDSLDEEQAAAIPIGPWLLPMPMTRAATMSIYSISDRSVSRCRTTSIFLV